MTGAGFADTRQAAYRRPLLRVLTLVVLIFAVFVTRAG
jgi:hypothetical protein